MRPFYTLLCIQVILIVLWKQLHERRKSQIWSQCWSYGVKYRKTCFANYNSLRKSIQLRVYSHPVKNVWISSLTLILIFLWIELVILGSHRNVYQNFVFNSGDIWKIKFVLHQILTAFFYTRKPVSSRVLVW